MLLAVLVTISTALSENPPNFVVHLADDCGYDTLSAYGADPELIQTPDHNRLAGR